MRGARRSALGCAPEHEKLSRQAEATSDPGAALKAYVAALQAVPAGDETGADFEIRKKAIACARKMSPPPAMPTEAQQHFVQAAVILNDSKDELARGRAAAEFAACLKSAPWHADAYYNLAALLEVAKDSDGALANYQLYLLANPGADNAKAVLAKVAALDLQRKKSGPAALEGIWRIVENRGKSEDPYWSHYVFTVRGRLISEKIVQDRDNPPMGRVKGDSQQGLTYELEGRRLKCTNKNWKLHGIVSEDFNEIYMTQEFADESTGAWKLRRFSE